MLAFLGAVPAVAREDQVAAPSLPTFKPRWWFKPNRLDARPVAWSLINRPEDWGWKRYSHHEAIEHNIIVHAPSKHEFWVAGGKGHYHLWDANCSCTSRSDGGKFQRWQQKLFHKAFTHWQNTHGNPPVDAAQFAAHFVR